MQGGVLPHYTEAMKRHCFLLGGILLFILAIAAWPDAGAPPTSREILAGLRATWKGIRDYQCRIYEWGAYRGRTDRRAVNYYYAQPGRIRVDVLDGSNAFETGSTLVFTGGEKVEGHKGGFLSWAVVKLDKYDPMVVTTRGLALDQTTVGAILAWLELGLEKGRVEVLMRNGNIWLTIDGIDPILNDGITREVVAFDPKSCLPVYSSSYAGTVQVLSSRWSDYAINTGLPERLFTARLTAREVAADPAVRLGGLAVDQSGYQEPPRR